MQDRNYDEIQKLKEENLMIKSILDKAIEQIDNLMDHTMLLAKTVNDHDKELAGISASKLSTNIDEEVSAEAQMIKEDYERLWGKEGLWGKEDSPAVDHVRYEEMEENRAKVIKMNEEDSI